MVNGKCETDSLHTAPLRMEKTTLLFSLFFLLLQLHSIATSPNVHPNHTTSIFVQMKFDAILRQDIPPQGRVDSLWVTDSGKERWSLISEPEDFKPDIFKTYNFTHTSSLPLLETKEVYLAFNQVNPQEGGWIRVSHFVVKEGEPDFSFPTTIRFCGKGRTYDEPTPVYFGETTVFAPC